MTILRCTEAFAVQMGVVPRVVQYGEDVDSDDPVVKGHEQHFEPVETHLARERAKKAGASPVETATAAPGEVRAVSRPPAKKAAPRKRTPAKPKGK